MRSGVKAGLFLGLGVLAGVGIYQATHRQAPGTSVAGDSPGALPQGTVPLGGAFVLRDQLGNRCTENSWPGKTLMIYFGYRFCPDICPMALGTLSQVMEALDPKGQLIQPLFITVDPERDTVEALADYAANFHPTFRMLTGTLKQIRQAMKAWRVYAAPAPQEGSTEPLIDHSSIIYVMDPNGQFLTHFHHTTPASEIIQGLRGRV